MGFRAGKEFMFSEFVLMGSRVLQKSFDSFSALSNRDMLVDEFGDGHWEQDGRQNFGRGIECGGRKRRPGVAAYVLCCMFSSSGLS
jgi:hypothetical protein